MNTSTHEPIYQNPEVWKAIAAEHGDVWARIGREVMTWPDDGSGMPALPDDSWAALDGIMDYVQDANLPDDCSIFDGLLDRVADMLNGVEATARQADGRA